MNAVTTMTTNPCNSALMLSQGLLAGHFTRAEQLQILNPEGNVIATLTNPAAAEGCHGKQALLDALAHYQVGQVVVRNIGERMLGRLLAANIRVLQCRSARLPLPALLAPANLQPLTEASQGRPSRRHQSKATIRAIQPVGAGHSHANCHGGCNSGANISLPRNGKIKRCAPVAAPAPARITSTRSASRHPKSNLSANAIAAEIRSAK
ncbi:NifB/NifX family molybdenum-iron cluster-binding protein [Aeromonas veronii]|uniref:NifB/NifX family molybdenum-iron cluster-binding protein n=1 Tax=Aeromonas veronii TaxID=654 RepID=UPI001F1E4CBF|nr:NifB/NifX family molybdenum-iron cluster-binding protein [Aeromonas veronii]